MPGDFLFPKRRFVDGEPLDTVELNEALQAAAERLNGHLGPHNIRAPLSTDVVADTGTFYRTEAVAVEVDPLLIDDSGAGGQSPQPGRPGTFMLEQETGWQPVVGAEDDMVIEMTTGVSDLVVTAHAAHCFAGDYDGGGAEFEATVPRFTDPELKNGNALNASSPALLSVVVRLDGSNYLLNKLEVPDARLFTSAHSQSVEIARRIVRGGPTQGGSSGIAANGWIATTGYAVSREGRTLTFVQQTPGAVSGTPSDFSITYLFETGAPYSDVFNMKQTKEPVTAVTAAAFSDLDSCDPVVNPTVVVYFPAQIQYALRVDGVVLPETITGRFDNEQSPFAPCRIVSPRTDAEPSGVTDVNDRGVTGPQVGRFRERPDGINIPMYTVRLTATFPVEPGDHIVELVVRRVPTGRRRSFTPPPPEVGNPSDTVTYLPNENRVYIYARQLAVTDVPREPVDAAVFGDPVTVAAFSEEDVVSKEALVDTRLQVIADRLNDVESFQVARGAITGDHLANYSSVIAVAEQAPFNSTAQVDSFNDNYSYPGGTATSFSVNPFYNGQLYPITENVSWRLVQEASFSATVGSNTAVTDCVITVEANVLLEQLAQVRSSDWKTRPTPTQTEMHLAAACFVIGLATGPDPEDWYLWRPSLSWANSNNYVAYQATKASGDLYPLSNTVGLHYLSHFGPNGTASIARGDEPGDFVDIPVTAVFNFSGSAPNGLKRGLIKEVTRVGLFATAAWMGSNVAGAYAGFRIREATINAVAMKS